MLLIPVLSEVYITERAISRFKELDKEFTVLLVIDNEKTDFFLSVADYMCKGKNYAEKLSEDLNAKLIVEWGSTSKKIQYLLHFNKADNVAFIKDPVSRPIIKAVEKEFPKKVIFV